MAYRPISAFQRPLTHAQLQRAERADSLSVALPEINKWALLRSLVKGQAQFGLGDRDLALLQGLLSFHPHETLRMGRDMVIFPSNRSICDRMNGMADSTMRRHLRKLISAGFLLRRDSHNGKRFAMTCDGERLAFGLDLSPLLMRAPEIFEAAAEQDAAEERTRRLRLDIQLMRRDIFALIPLLAPDLAERASAFWHDATKVLRRKASEALLQDLHLQHSETLTLFKASVLNSSDVQNEQQIHNSNIKIYESKEELEELEANDGSKDLRLETVLAACPEIQRYCEEPITQWSRLIKATRQVSRYIGISEAGHHQAENAMGQAGAAVVIAAMLQRLDKIRSPGAYLRTLVAKANLGVFNCRPMVQALLSAA